MQKLKQASLLISFLLMSGCYSTPESDHFIKEVPEQYEIWEDKITLNKNFHVKTHHYYSLDAVVLSKKSYKNSWDGEVQPYDFVLGWKKMSDNTFLENVQIEQRGRWYYYKWEDPSIKMQDIRDNSSNTHMIPANNEVREKLEDVNEGEAYHFKGYLASLIFEKDAKRVVQKSSIKRNDSGDGACERFYVEEVIKILK